jgi:ankyrin repeat protein
MCIMFLQVLFHPRFIVDKGGTLSAADKHGWSVLQYAIRYASLETVEALIDLGCDIFHKEKKGWSCLHLAARNGQPDKARTMLERGAKVNETQDQVKHS